MSTGTVLPRTVAGRRTALAALALVLAIAGGPFLLAPYVFLPTTRADDRWFVTGLLAAWCLPPLIGVLWHGRRVQRWACLVGFVVTGVPTLVFSWYGGFYQLPAVVALGLVVTVPDRVIFPGGSSWLTKIGWIALALVVVYVGLNVVGYVSLFVLTIVARIVLSA